MMSQKQNRYYNKSAASDARKVVVTNLPIWKHKGDMEVFKVMKGVGFVKDVTMLSSSHTAQTAIVEYATVEEAANAVRVLNGIIIGDQSVVVMPYGQQPAANGHQPHFHRCGPMLYESRHGQHSSVQDAFCADDMGFSADGIGASTSTTATNNGSLLRPFSPCITSAPQRRPSKCGMLNSATRPIDRLSTLQLNPQPGYASQSQYQQRFSSARPNSRSYSSRAVHNGRGGRAFQRSPRFCSGYQDLQQRYPSQNAGLLDELLDKLKKDFRMEDHRPTFAKDVSRETLPINDLSCVNLLGFVSPKNIWLQLEATAQELNSLQTKMNDFYSTAYPKPLPFYPKVGEVIAARSFNEPSLYYRAIIKGKRRDDEEAQVYRVQLADYGHVLDVPRAMTRPLEAEFLKLRFQGIACELADLLPPEECLDFDGGKCVDAITSFANGYVLDDIKFFAECKRYADGIAVIQLHMQGNHDFKWKIADELVKVSLGRYEDGVATDSLRKSVLLTSPVVVFDDGLSEASTSFDEGATTANFLMTPGNVLPSSSSIDANKATTPNLGISCIADVVENLSGAATILPAAGDHHQTGATEPETLQLVTQLDQLELSVTNYGPSSAALAVDTVVKSETVNCSAENEQQHKPLEESSAEADAPKVVELLVEPEQLSSHFVTYNQSHPTLEQAYVVNEDDLDWDASSSSSDN